tara:strand:+ start:10425 stop:10601 length:177 start_codon:yes stop_codon:yes gene_type:complete
MTTKMEKRAKCIIKNEQKEKRARRNLAVKDFIEYKMLRGHSRETASKMAQSLIDDNNS